MQMRVSQEFEPLAQNSGHGEAKGRTLFFTADLRLYGTSGTLLFR